jgi:glutathionylspermidine synthase
MLYKEHRKQFYSTIPDYWSDLSGVEYSLYQTLSLTPEDILEIRKATEKLGRLYFKTAHILRKMSDNVLLQLGFPKAVLPYLRFKSIGPETIISRFDFVKKGSQIKMLEFNSDTPTFIKECFQINGYIAEHFSHSDPNARELVILGNAVTKAIVESVKTLTITDKPNIVFAAHDDYSEDWLTCKFLSHLTPIPSKLHSLKDLRLIKNMLLDADGERIDILYRQTYPLEFLIEDTDDDGTKIGLELLELVKMRKLALINPISSFLLQSKAVQAFIWGLRTNREIYTLEDFSIIEQYMLPTYLENKPFLGSVSYVRKPVFGREGDTVAVYKSNGDMMTKDKRATYHNELQIYQEYVELPQLFIETEKGKEHLSYLFGSFLIAGNASAIGARAGGKITANESYFLPIHTNHF